MEVPVRDRLLMRLRSSQFVFLLLLVCSVQNRDVIALHLGAGEVSGSSTGELQQRNVASAAAEQHLPSPLAGDLFPREVPLDAASRAAQATPWSMRRPAMDSAAVSSFTGFLRA